MADLSDQAGEDENAMPVRTIESDCSVSAAGLAMALIRALRLGRRPSQGRLDALPAVSGHRVNLLGATRAWCKGPIAPNRGTG